jgi:hypothetical protein
MNSATGRRAAIGWGLAAVAITWLAQSATVHYNFGGNWTALFYVHAPQPAFAASENLYTHSTGDGYDGQFYHLIAHDPWIRRGVFESIESPAMRYQRILVPALAWFVALGRDSQIHAAYIAVILGFAFLGVYWLSRVAASNGLASAWGLMFLLTPGAITSIDRLTTDIALAALTAGFALYARASRTTTLVILVFAALSRETGLALTAGYTLYFLSKKRFRDAAFAAATALPAIAWWIHLPDRNTAAASFVDWLPFEGFLERVLHPVTLPVSPMKNAAAIALDYAALAGVALAFGFVIRLALRREWNERTAGAYMLALSTAFLRSTIAWLEVYGFGRILTPFLLLTAVEMLPQGVLIAFLPMLLIDARMSLDLARQFLGVIHGLIGR